MISDVKIILASASPRRKYLLGMLLNNFGLKFQVIPANIEEYTPKSGIRMGFFVQNLSLCKAKEVARNNKGIIIAADTMVVLGQKIMGKPENEVNAVKMLKSLSGKAHFVYTGISIIDSTKNKVYKTFEKTIVKFRNLNNSEIKFYVNSGSPMDKAGAYGIQDDFGSTFVEKINGDYFNVVGLPIVKTYLGLKKFLPLSI